jgi:drug/metabolite transporter (DMT)-like permease
MTEKKADMLLLLAAVVWGSSYVFSNILLDDGLPSLQIMALRFLLSCIGMILVFNKKLFAGFSPDAVKCGVAIGVSHFCGLLLELKGIELSSASKAGFLVSTNVIFLPFLIWIVFKKRPKTSIIFCTITTFFGIGLLSLKSDITFNLGDFLLVVAGLMYAISTAALLKLAKNASRIQITFFQFVSITLLSAVFLIFTGGVKLNISAESWGSLIYLAATCSILCYILKNWALKFTSATRGTIILSTEGIFTAILSAIILREMMTPRMIIGALIIFGSIIYAELHSDTKDID